jgi:hypothetical protein
VINKGDVHGRKGEGEWTGEREVKDFFLELWKKAMSNEMGAVLL